jgi:hypothetical protein
MSDNNTKDGFDIKYIIAMLRTKEAEIVRLISECKKKDEQLDKISKSGIDIHFKRSLEQVCILREALKNIITYQHVISGSMSDFSTITQIAQKALTSTD